MKRTLLLLSLAAAPLAADEVFLKGGGQISGVIVAQNDKTVTVDIGGGTLAVQMSTVVKIEKSESPLQTYRKREAELGANDVEGWRELARWAEGEALATQARKAWSRVLESVPGDAEANQALGRVQLDGQWMSEAESYAARGFVEFEGDWVTPDERLAILDARAREEEAHAASVQAEIAANQQAAADEAARRQEEHDEYWNSWSNYNDPFYWGGGSYGGVTYWPTVPGPRVGGPGGARASQLPARAGGGRGR